MSALLLHLIVASASAQELKPVLLGQIWTTVYDMDLDPQADPTGYGDPEDDIGFKVRRARAGFVGSWERLDYSVVVGMSAGADPILGAATEAVELVDAFVGYTWGQPASLAVNVSGGVVRVPFGRENLMSVGQLPFQERTVQSNHLGPFREAGVLGDLQHGGLRLRVGAFNGDGSYLGDRDPGLLLASRAEYTLGSGDPYRTYGIVEGFTLGVAGDFMWNPEYATTTTSFGGDVIARAGGLTVLVEGHGQRIVPTGTDIEAPGVLDPTLRWGGFAQVGYALGMWEPVARVELFDDNTAATDNGDVALGTFGVTGHLLEDHLRLGGGYVLRLERGGQSLPNDTVRLWAQVNIGGSSS